MPETHAAGTHIPDTPPVPDTPPADAVTSPALMAETLPFPSGSPAPYIRLGAEPGFDAEKHLDLSVPSHMTPLADFGYGERAIAACPSPLGVTSAFKILSEEGVAAMTALAHQMYTNRNESAGTGAMRLGSYIRGAGYRSKFMRDFCDSPALAAHLSALAGVRLARHSVPAVACGINYAPEDITRAVDTWHVDSVSFDVVMLLTDPDSFEGGAFQYFTGTKEEGQALLGISGEEGGENGIPDARIVSMDFVGAGHGFMQQGNMIFHRACQLRAPAERITVIPSFVVAPAHAHDATNSVNMVGWDDPGIVPELARHEMWRAAARLDRQVADTALEASPETLGAEIDMALAPLLAFRNRLKEDEATE